MQARFSPNAAAWFYRILLVVFLLIFAFVWIRNAWLSDDAYITLRTVYNFLHGLGPNFNPGERVQTYTHPLWFLVLIPTHALTGEGYYSTLALSFFISLATLFLLIKFLARTPQQALFAIGAMILSGAYIDYSSSGLENPLSQLMLALFFIPFFATTSMRRLFWASLAAALITLTRFDLILIVLPPLVLVFIQTWQAYPQQRRRVLATLAVGFVPLLLWCLFALVYYGMLLPNTYYAKMPANVSLAMWLGQGWNYFLHSLRVDPITLAVIAFAVGVAIYARDRALICIAGGIILYLIYVWRIGGDFMSGRFFTAPFFCALIILVRVELLSKFEYLASIALGALLLGFLAPRPPILSDETFGALTDPERIALVGPDRVTDQRAFYYHWTGLLRNLDGMKNFEQLTEVQEGLRVRAGRGGIFRTTGMGIRSYYAGPAIYVVDELALADPFLAWLPRKDGWWLIGHFTRCPPLGYAVTIQGKTIVRKRRNFIKNEIQEPALAELYEQLWLLERSNLLDSRRLAAILKLNLGSYNSLRSRIYPCENFWGGSADPASQIAK